MILILLALLVLGIGLRYTELGPRTKNGITFGLFVVAVCVILYYAGVLRVG